MTADVDRWLVRATRLRSGILLAGLDVLLVALCFLSLLLVRYNGAVPGYAWEDYLRFLPLAVGTFLLAHTVAGLYGRMWRYAGIEEARRIILAGFAAGLALTLAVGWERLVPLPVAAGGAVFTTMLVGTTRFQARLFAFRRRAEVGDGMRVVVLGAGDTGAMLVRQMQEVPRSGLLPVAMLDDDPARRGRSLYGVRVAGRFADLPVVARRYDAHQALLAVPTADRATVQRVADLAEAAGVALRVLPEPGSGVDGPVSLSDVRGASIEDLLGRSQVRTDLTAAAELIRGRRVLVTGGGGSIGSEIVRQVARLMPSTLIALDHDETHLHDTVEPLYAPDGVVVVSALCDVRDAAALDRVFDEHRPEVVFHAAAHKHVPLLEAHAVEAALTNVLGTQAVVRAAERVGTARLVLVSTDKAVRPSSVMGASKRMAEQLVVEAALSSGRRWCAVRFGNVLGSRGSVVPTFLRQIGEGGPVTLTDPRMTRYFMTIPEAVALVIQAATMSEGADLFMLDMGDPVRVLDLARRMVRLSGNRLGDDVEIRVTGLRPGEKLHEELSTPDERAEPTTHPSVTRLHPVPVGTEALAGAVARLSEACARGDDEAVRVELHRGAAVRAPEQPVLPSPRPAPTHDHARTRGTEWNRATT